MELGDGSILQGGLKFHKRKANPEETVRYIPYPVRAQIIKVYAIDDPLNVYGETTICDLFVTSKNLYLYRVPFQLNRASLDNYVHVGTPQAASKNVDGSTFNGRAPNPQVSNGDSVIVQFIDASVLQPIIVAMAPQVQSGYNGISPSPRPDSGSGGPSENEGNDVLKIRFNGTNFWIDDGGNVLFENTAAYNAAISKNKKFVIDFADGSGNSAMLVLDNSDAGNPQATLSATSGGNTQSMVLNSSGVVVNVTGTATVKATGKVTVSGEKIYLDGTGEDGDGATANVLCYPVSLSDFTGLPIQPYSDTVLVSE